MTRNGPSYSGATLCNNLPSNVRVPRSLSALKKGTEKHLIFQIELPSFYYYAIVFDYELTLLLIIDSAFSPC